MSSDKVEPQKWPIFICYRHVDGFATARRLHEILDQLTTTVPGGQQIVVDVYLDMPGVADWQHCCRVSLAQIRRSETRPATTLAKSELPSTLAG